MRLFQRLLDWWRGWGDQDVHSALRKIQHNQTPGNAYRPLSNREMVALIESRAWHQEHQEAWGR